MCQGTNTVLACSTEVTLTMCCMYFSLQDDILLEVEDLYYLLLEFPQPVKEDPVSAIFNKKKRRLTLTLEVV